MNSLARTGICALLLGLNAWPLAAQASKSEKSDQPAQLDRMRTEGHQEVPRDAYVPVPRRARVTSPAAVIEYNGHVSHQVNVDEFGNNIVGDAANEPSIAVSPVDPFNMVIGWRQFDTIASDFRQAGNGYTLNGGETWTVPSVIEPGVFRSDPVVDADSNGHFFYNSLTADASHSNFWCHVYKSVDGGATWDAGTYAYGGDKQWQTIDTTGGIGNGNIYASWNEVFSSCSGHFTRSVNNGGSFQSCVTAPGSPYWGTLAVGPDGELYLSGQGFVVDGSTNAQNPAQSIVWDLNQSVNLGGSIVISSGPNPGGLLGQAWVAVDHSSGATRGNVYLLCSVDPSGSDPLDIMFARSTNGGQTWSSPVRVNDDSTSNGAWQWFGTMDVAPNGRIDVIWLDTRGDPGGYDSQLYYAYSNDAGVTWSTNEALGPQFDPHVGWPQQNKMGDYFDIKSDELGANVAYAATYNGEQDVYYIRLGDPLCSDAGELTLDRPEYPCEGTIEVRVVDCGLNTDDQAIEQVTVDIDSDSEPGVEQVALTETAPTTAMFVGTIDVSETNAPGVLWVAEGETITVTYVDADDGEGGVNVVVTADAVVDCTPPVISNVAETVLGPRTAEVTFDTDEAAVGSVQYGSACGVWSGSAAEAGYGTSHTVSLTGLPDGATIYYEAGAEDEAGNSASDDNGGLCYSFTTPDVPDFFTEQFDADNDLDFTQLRFEPDGGFEYYRGCAETIADLPTDPVGGITLTLSDDDSEQVSLTSGQQVSLYGISYSSFYVGSNGYLTFGVSDTDYSETTEEHFDTPRVSALYDDLTPGDGGTVSYKQLADRIAVTFENVPEYSETNSNTFQYELYFDGRITISYLGVDAVDGIAGLSAGTGQDPDFLETDLSEMPCDPTPPTALDVEASTAAYTSVTVVLNGLDDGLPEPLEYTITQLPAHGSLSDPQAGPILAAGYVLANGGDEVAYTPGPCFVGQDTFHYLADDGGIPPEGGQSNEATVTVDVSLEPGTPGVVYSFPLDADPGWSTEGQWAFGQPTGGGSYNRDPSSGYVGDNVYGYNLNGNYEAGMTETLYLTTAAIDCSSVTETELRFRRWLGVESSPFDNASVEVSANGVDWTVVWANPTTSVVDLSWALVSYDLSAVADLQSTVYMRWGMGPTDGGAHYPGWNIDEVEIHGIQRPAGDFDGDGSVDLFDHSAWMECLVGPEGVLPADCDCADLDGDLDADLGDFAVMQDSFIP